MGKKKPTRTPKFKKIVDQLNRENAKNNAGPKNLNIVMKKKRKQMYGENLAQYKIAFDTVMEKWTKIGETFPSFIVTVKNEGGKPSLIKILTNLNQLISDTEEVMAPFIEGTQNLFELVEQTQEELSNTKKNNNLFIGDMLYHVSQNEETE